MSDLVIDLKYVHTGEVRRVEQKTPNTWATVYFAWTEGNDSCDCNRGAMFYENDQYPEDCDICTEGRFLARVTLDGETVVDEIGDAGA